MTVTPHRHLLTSNFPPETLRERQTLKAPERPAPRPLSLMLPLVGVDPLMALEELAPEYPNYFYWQQGDRATAAFGIAAARSIRGLNRFTAAQEFLSQVGGSTSYLGVKPLVYCYFPFAPEPLDPNQPFSDSYLCLPRWQVERRGDRSFLIANGGAHRPPEILAAEMASLRDRLESLGNSSRLVPPAQPAWQADPIDDLEPSIALALADIQDQALQKIVLAQTHQLTAPQNFSIPRSLANLRRQYPDCYTFAVSDGRGHCFLGASPERLLAVQNRQLTCDTLAGSAPRGSDRLSDRQLAETLLTNPKELHEHRLVRDFIVEQLQNLGLQPAFPHPQLLQLTNIQHVWTPIQATLPGSLSPLTILSALHPTPAVAGIPQALACQKIREYEQTDRGLYAAPIGWLDLEGNCELVVGIRSALVHGNRAKLYAGAGIVAGSEAPREVAEIQLKFQPLYRALSI
jgi:menaquinone-specific isochorismate synthase